MDLIGFAITVAIIASASLLYFLTKQAFANGDWSQLRAMASEFVAVFAAFALATWLSIEERKADRASQQEERRAERREQADALLVAAENFTKTLSSDVVMPRTALFMPSLPNPSIFETMFSSADVHVFHSPEATVLIEKAGQLRTLLFEAPSDACSLTAAEKSWVIATVTRIPRNAAITIEQNHALDFGRLACLQDRIHKIEEVLETIRVVACAAPLNDSLSTLDELRSTVQSFEGSPPVNNSHPRRSGSTRKPEKKPSIDFYIEGIPIPETCRKIPGSGNFVLKWMHDAFVRKGLEGGPDGERREYP